MIAPLRFASIQEYRACLGNLDFWLPYLAEILARHELDDTAGEPVAGFNATYPTFVCDQVVVKLFGQIPSWRKAHAFERAAHTLIATDPEIAAPRLLAEGRLFDRDPTWPYLITTRISGIASWRAELSARQRLSVAAELGAQIRRVHALRPVTGVATDANWQTPSVAAAAGQSSLPAHLVAQVDGYLARLEPFDRVFVHADLCANHVYVEHGRLVGIIDWGDAMVTDRHAEIIQVFRDMFACDKALLQTFLEASDWPVGKGFARQALGLALHRQAVGLAQHFTIDVFEPIAARFPLNDIATLDELATELFAV